MPASPLVFADVCGLRGALSGCRVALSLPPANAADGSRITIDEAGVRRQEIRTNLVGDFYLPTTTGRAPGIILLGGSDGEPMKERSAFLASRGYAVLNLFYFGHASLPKELSEVPVEYLTNAVLL
jgi:hypothetical protein